MTVGEGAARTDMSRKSEESNTHCLRCLLQELDPEKYKKDIRRILVLMDKEEKASEKVYKQRLETCRCCEYLYEGTCNACGCYAELRAAGKATHCPYKKW